MSELYKEFQVFCSTHNHCSDCKYKDIERCHFSWIEDKTRADEQDRIIKELKELAKQTDTPEYKGDVEVDLWIKLSEAIEIVKRG